MDGKSQETAAASAGMSPRTARRWREGALPSASKPPRCWRTRKDPLDGIWEHDVVPLLESDAEHVLRAPTLLDLLQERYPDRVRPTHLRTLQRRLRDWRALHGPDREVIFPQEHEPGREAAFDFTHGTSLGVTIGGRLFEHLLFHLVLSFSDWIWARIVFGETFEALVSCLQDALWELGGVPEVVRHDNLSAATHELRRTGGRALNRRFAEVLDHYGLRSTRIRPGESHENGVAEKTHDVVKSSLAQALVIRGSRDFADTHEYECFVREVIDKARNRHVGDALAAERECLRPLPTCRVPSHTVHEVKVRCWSTIRVGGRIYSVPSRLIGHRVRVHQHPDHLELYYGSSLVETMPRLRGEAERRIDYRHVIWSLVRKPGAFARYRFREELFPSLVFRQTYDALERWRGERADIEYVRILHLAASTMESLVETSLESLLAEGRRFDYAAVKQRAQPGRPEVPLLQLPAPDLGAYDGLLTVGGVG